MRELIREPLDLLLEQDRIATELMDGRFEGRKNCRVWKEKGYIYMSIRGNFTFIHEDLENGYKKIIDLVYGVKTRLTKLERHEDSVLFEYQIMAVPDDV